jgi:hypothetical protein|tara:strand:+ start:699 stop:851 length:153 start_codon:yes stop_codon:yes gene_type:complete
MLIAHQIQKDNFKVDSIENQKCDNSILYKHHSNHGNQQMQGETINFYTLL